MSVSAISAADTNNASDVVADTGTFADLAKDISAGGNISLTRDYIQTDSHGQIAITKNTIINGNGHTIDAQAKSRIFNIANGVTVSLKNITFINGSTTTHGGAIYNQGDLTVDNCQFKNTTAQYGGAIYSLYSNVNVVDSIFKDITAGNVGGVICSFDGSVNVVGSTFTDTTATNMGGVIYSWSIDGGVTVTNSTFINATSKSGGAISIGSGSNLAIIGCTLINNTANNGGAIYSNCNLNVIDSNFTNTKSKIDVDNEGGYGGAISSVGTVTVSGSTFTNVLADVGGGAIYGYTNNTIFLTNSTFINATSKSGGGIFIGNDSSVAVMYCNFINNTANKNGGAIYTNKCYVTVTDSKFKNCQAPEGGSDIYANERLTLVANNYDGKTTYNSTEVVGSPIVNIAPESFKAVQLYIDITPDNSVLNLPNRKFTANEKDYTLVVNKNITINGQGTILDANSRLRIMYIEHGLSVTLKNIIFTNSVFHSMYDGGGVIFVDSSNLTIIDSSFINCASKFSYSIGGNGGAFYLYNSNITIIGSNFINITADGAGGVVYMEGGNLNVTGSTFTNTAASSGGVIFAQKCDIVTFSNSSFINSTSEINGGAILCNSHICTVNNSTFINNVAKTGTAGAIDSFSNMINVTDSFFSNNRARYGGGDIRGIGITITHSIFKKSHADKYGTSITADANLNIKDSNFYSPYADGTAVIYVLSSSHPVNLTNNTIESNILAIYNKGGKIVSPTSLTFDNVTVEISENALLTATLTDDMGNIIGSNTKIRSKVENNYVYFAFNETTKKFNVVYNKFDDLGNYTITGSYDDAKNCTVTDGVLTVVEHTPDFKDLQAIINAAPENSVIYLNGTVYNTKPGQPVVLIDKNITILGCSEDDSSLIATLNAKGLSGIFNIASGVSVTLKNITFINGNDMTYAYGGGSIFNNGSLTADNCYFKNSTAYDGGAICNYGNVVVSNSIFTNTKASNEGGAIYNNNGTVVVSNSNFTNSIASIGAGISSHLTNISIFNSSFINNTADNKMIGGGALFNFDCNVTVVDSSFTNTVANEGTDLYSFGGIVNLICNDYEGKTRYNSSEVFFFGWSELDKYIVSGTFAEVQYRINTTENNGILNLKNKEYTADENDTTIVINKNITINGQGATLNGNDSLRIMSIDNGVSVTLENMTFINGTTSDNGGGIFNKGDLIVDDCNFKNTEAGQYGGVIYNDGNVTVTDSTFDHTKSTYSGGAIYNRGSVTVSNSTFDNIIAIYAGGAIYSRSDVIVSNSTFNYTLGQYGGAICSIGSVIVSNSTFNENSAKENGASIYTKGSLNVIDSTFNSTNVEGNAVIYIQSSNMDVNLTNNTIESNLLAIYNDGGNFVSPISLKFANVVVDVGDNATLTALLTDDKGNIIGSKTNVTGKVNGNDIIFVFNETTRNFTGKYNKTDVKGEYIINGSYSKASDLNVINGTLFVGTLTNVNITFNKTVVIIGGIVKVTGTTVNINSGSNITIYVNGGEVAVVCVNSTGGFTYDLNTNNCTIGSNNITAIFEGNDTVFASNTTAILTVNPLPTNVSIEFDENEVILGEVVKVTGSTINVTNGSNITIYVNGGEVAVVCVNSTGGFTYELNTTCCTIGSNNITAKFKGNEIALPSNVTATLIVNKMPTSIVIDLNATEVVGGVFVKLNGTTINITDGSNITISINGLDVANVTVNNNKFNYTIDSGNIEGGINYIIASFKEDSIALPSNATATLIVNKMPTSIVIDLNATEVVGGVFVKLNGTTINITDGSNIIISINGLDVANVTVNNNKFNYTIDSGNLEGGINYIIASFKENSVALPSNATATLTVNKIPTSLNINLNTTVVIIGDKVKVNGVSVNISEGSNITIYVNGEEVAIVFVNSTGGFTYELNTGNFAIGSNNITAMFIENETSLPSNATAILIVNKMSTSLNINLNTTVVIIGDKVKVNGVSVNISEGSNITIYVNGEEVAVVFVNSTGGFTYELNTDNFAIGSNNITAMFKENKTSLPSNATAILIVNKLPTSVGIDFNVTEVIVGDIVKLTGITNNITNGSVIKIYVNGDYDGYATVDLTGGFTYELNTDNCVVGFNNITAVFEGNDTSLPSNATAILTVNKLPTSVGIDLNVTEVIIGDIVKLTGISNNITDGSIIKIYINGNYGGNASVDLTGGFIYDIDTKNLFIGSNNITAVFEGNDTSLPSNATAILTVNKMPTSIVIDFNVTEVIVGDIVKLTGITNNITNGSIIKIYINGNYEGNAFVNLTGGFIYELDTDNFAIGSNNIAAVFEGDDISLPSNATAILIVNKAFTSIGIDLNATEVFVGDIVKLTGITNNIADGSIIKIYVNGDYDGYATVDLTGGFAYELNTDNCVVGFNNITAVFEGNDTSLSSNATAILIVNKMSTSIGINLNVTEVIVGDIVKLTGISNNITNGSIIKIYINGNYGGNASVDSNGSFTYDIDTKNLFIGNNNITAIFEGDKTLLPSNSTVNLKVNSKPSPTIIIRNITADEGQNITVSGNTTYIPDYENVTIKIANMTYTATVTNNSFYKKIGELPIGSYNYTVSYSNVTAKATITVKAVPSITIDDIKDAVVNENITIEGTTANIPDNENVTIKVNGNEYNVTVNNNRFITDIPGLPFGNYTYTVSYGNITKSANIIVRNAALITTDEEINTTIDDDVIIKGVIIPPNSNVTIIVGDNKTFTVTSDDNGNFSQNIGKLTVGTHIVVISFAGNDNYTYYDSRVTIHVNSTVTLEAPSITKYYRNGTQFIVKVTEGAMPSVGAKIAITINGITYNRTTDMNGTAKLNINLLPGEYDVNVIAIGAFGELTTNSTVTVLSTIKANDTSLYYRNGTKFKALLVDEQGNPLNNTKVIFNINGVFYKKTTNENGTASLKINLKPGEYIITTTNIDNGEKYSNNITVLPTIQTENLVKYYKNGTQFIAKSLDGQGNALPGQNLTFNINGVIYYRTTDENGEAKLNINLAAGNSVSEVYGITTECNGCTVFNTVEVLPVITGEELTLKYHSGAKYNVNVYDGQGNPENGVNITFNINGVNYHRTSNAEGTTSGLTINLLPGKYVITAIREDNKATISNNITVIQ